MKNMGKKYKTCYPMLFHFESVIHVLGPKYWTRQGHHRANAHNDFDAAQLGASMKRIAATRREQACLENA